MHLYRFKGAIMDVSASTSSNTQSSTQVETTKKAVQVQEEAIVKIIDSANEESREVSAQKTGMGNGIDLTA
jgi:hypothetical protein